MIFTDLLENPKRKSKPVLVDGGLFLLIKPDRFGKIVFQNPFPYFKKTEIKERQ